MRAARLRLDALLDPKALSRLPADRLIYAQIAGRSVLDAMREDARASEDRRLVDLCDAARAGDMTAARAIVDVIGDDYGAFVAVDEAHAGLPRPLSIELKPDGAPCHWCGTSGSHQCAGPPSAVAACSRRVVAAFVEGQYAAEGRFDAVKDVPKHIAGCGRCTARHRDLVRERNARN